MKLLIKILVVCIPYYVSLHWYESYFRYVKRLLLSSRHLIASVPTDFPPTAARYILQAEIAKKAKKAKS